MNEKLEGKKGNIDNKLVYSFSLDTKIKKVELIIKANNDKILEKNPSCLIKYQLDKYQEFKYKFKKEITVSKKDNELDVSFNSLESLDNNDIKNNLKITYTIYLCKKIENIDNMHPEFLEESNIIEKQEIIKNGNETDKIQLAFNTTNDQEYTIIVLATVNYDEYKEYFIYQSFSSGKRRVNDIIFYIIMGTFALVIIVVFIIIFCIINKRKANNPDIDDEEYSNLKILRETINEDEI